MATKSTIEIDLELHKFIEANRKTFSESSCEIIKRSLGLTNNEVATTSTVHSEAVQNGGGITLEGGIYLPQGTELKKDYKGQIYLAIVDSGTINLNGKQFHSPSMAAIEITQYNVNGWWFWDVRLPDQETWKKLGELRNF